MSIIMEQIGKINNLALFVRIMDHEMFPAPNIEKASRHGCIIVEVMLCNH